MRQPVCPNKQPAEGGCLIITSPLFSHPEFTFHLTTNTGPRLWLCPLSLLEFRDVSGASKATIHMLFSTWRGQHSTRQRPGRGETKTQWVFVTFRTSEAFKVDALYSLMHCLMEASFYPWGVLLFTRLPPSLPDSLSLKDPSAPRRMRPRSDNRKNLNYQGFRQKVANICKKCKSVHICLNSLDVKIFKRDMTRLYK